MMPRLLWVLQRITGALLVVLLVLHFWVEHFVSENLRRGNLTYADIRARVASPLWQTVDIAFLLIALLHGLSGARNILLDFSRLTRRGARLATVALCAAGIVWAWWGIQAFRNLR